MWEMQEVRAGKVFDGKSSEGLRSLQRFEEERLCFGVMKRSPVVLP